MKVFGCLCQESEVDSAQNLEGSGSGDFSETEPGSCGYGLISLPKNPDSCIRGAKVQVEMTYDMEFNEVLFDKDSVEYSKAKDNFEQQLFTLYTPDVPHLMSVIVLDIQPGSVIVKHEVNQFIADDVDLSQATSTLVNRVQQIGNDETNKKHFQILSLKVIPIKTSYKVKFVLDESYGGAGLPDEQALFKIQKGLSSLRPKGNFVSEPFYATRDRSEDTITVYGFLQLPENVILADYMIDAKRSKLYFYQFDELPPTTRYPDPSRTTLSPRPPKTPAGGGGVLGNPAVLAAIISGVAAALFCLVLITIFIVCRMRKRDTGSIELETKMPHHLNGAGGADPRNMYMYNKPDCHREIYA